MTSVSITVFIYKQAKPTAKNTDPLPYHPTDVIIELLQLFSPHDIAFADLTN